MGLKDPKASFEKHAITEQMSSYGLAASLSLLAEHVADSYLISYVTLSCLDEWKQSVVTTADTRAHKMKKTTVWLLKFLSRTGARKSYAVTNTTCKTG